MTSLPTLPHINLSHGYREAQRLVARWLESSPRDARRLAFAARAALGHLDRSEHDRLARWLAWTCVAARSQGRDDVMIRLERLDGAMGHATTTQLGRLPGQRLPRGGRLRHSA